MLNKDILNRLRAGALVILVAIALIALIFVVLGGISVWTHDEHPPLWIPPEPSGVKKLPPVYDQEREDAEWVERFIEETRDP